MSDEGGARAGPAGGDASASDGDAGRVRHAGAPARLGPIVALLGPPALWAAHLGLCYLFVTLACNAGWTGAGWAVGVATAVLGAGAFWLGWLGSSAAIEAGTESVSMLLRLGRASGLLFGLTILLTGVVPLFARLCW